MLKEIIGKVCSGGQATLPTLSAYRLEKDLTTFIDELDLKVVDEEFEQLKQNFIGMVSNLPDAIRNEFKDIEHDGSPGEKRDLLNFHAKMKEETDDVLLVLSQFRLE